MPTNSAGRPVRTQCVLALCAALTLAACSAKYARVPPRLDLAPYGRVALVAFSTEGADSAASALATRRFAEALLASQSGVELLELGPSDSTVRALAAAGDGSALAQALGRDRDIPAVFVGHLRTSGVTPRGRIGYSGVRLNATVSAELSVRLLSTRTGGTVWRSSAAADETVGRLAVSQRVPSVAVRSHEAAYGELVEELVTGVTRDLRPTWVKQ